MKHLRIFTSICLLFAFVLCLAACGDKTETTSETTVEDYKTAYAEFLADYLKDADEDTVADYKFVLVDINGDDTPELILDTQVYATGMCLMTYADGTVDYIDDAKVSENLSNMSYSEGNNLVVFNGGQQGSYTDAIYTIEDGKWKELHFGSYSIDPTVEAETDEKLDCTWDGDEVTEEEYDDNYNEALDGNDVTYLNSSETGISYTELLEQLAK